MGVDGSLYMAVAPDGMPAAHGIVSSTLRDMARFGMLYTPSWYRVSSTPIVRPEHISRIRQGVRSETFYDEGVLGPRMREIFGQGITGNSYQWDAIFEDGDFFKGGLMSQGLYVSPDRDLVIAYFFTTLDQTSAARFLRPIAKTIATPS